MLEQESLRSWVDSTSLNSVLAGITILVLTFLACRMWVRLWQQSLAEDAALAVKQAVAMGLNPRPLGFRSRIVARGELAGTDASVTWIGGMWGQRTVIALGDRVQRLPFLTDPEQLERTLSAMALQRQQERQRIR